MAYFSGYQYTITGYIESKCTLAEKIAAMEVLEAAMMASMLDYLSLGADGTRMATISMYELDDGQVRIKTGFTSFKELTNGLDNLRKIKNIYINQFNGRTFVLQDKRNFR